MWFCHLHPCQSIDDTQSLNFDNGLSVLNLHSKINDLIEIQNKSETTIIYREKKSIQSKKNVCDNHICALITCQFWWNATSNDANVVNTKILIGLKPSLSIDICRISILLDVVFSCWITTTFWKCWTFKSMLNIQSIDRSTKFDLNLFTN